MGDSYGPPPPFAPPTPPPPFEIPDDLQPLLYGPRRMGFWGRVALFALLAAAVAAIYVVMVL